MCIDQGDDGVAGVGGASYVCRRDETYLTSSGGIMTSGAFARLAVEFDLMSFEGLGSGGIAGGGWGAGG